MLTREPDITRLFDRLVRAELVERTRSESDRRVVLVSLTTRGKKLVDKLHRPAMTLHRKQLGRLGVRKLRLLSELLEEARTEEK
jgi:DNA-binding MarR family transcriptional regulator